MMKTNELLSMAESLPIEIKIQLIDTLLNSMHPSQSEIDELWAKEAERRVDQIKSGEVKTISGEDVFKKIQDRFSK
jgi:putative addiction module component (TIGR02574 family)